MRRRPFAELALATLVFAAGVALYLGPSVVALAAHLGPDLGDPRLNLYFVTWVAHCLADGCGDVWSPPFFFPTSGALAFSDHLFGPGVAVWLAGLAGVGRVTAFNLLFLASFALSGVTAFWLFRRLRLELWPALLGGWFVAFSHLRWDGISHYQVLRAQWIPLVLWCFDRFVAQPGKASLAAFLGAYLLHVSGGSYLTYMVHVPMAVILAVRLREVGWRRFFAPMRAKWLLAGAVASLAVLAPFVWGYLAQWGSRTIERQLWEVRSAGVVSAALVSPSHEALVRSLGFFTHGSERGALFPGFVLLTGCLAVAAARLRPAPTTAARLVGSAALAAAGVATLLWGLSLADAYTLDQRQADWLVELGLRRYNGPRTLAGLGLLLIWIAARRWPRRPAQSPATSDPFPKALLVAGALCAWLALPVGYTTVYRQLPGMAAMRVSHRFFVFALLALAYLGAAGLQLLARGVRPRAARVALMLVLTVAAVVEATPRRWRWVPVPERPADFPAYAHFLARSDDVSAYLEYPTYGNYRDGEWMHNQTLHWKPLANGYSARIAGSYRRVADLFDPFPDRGELARLRRQRISHLVFHWQESPRRRSRAGQKLLLARIQAATTAGSLEPVYQDAVTSVYRIVAGDPERLAAPGG